MTDSWPEQDIVYAWLEEWGIDMPHKDVLPLLERLTALRQEGV